MTVDSKQKRKPVVPKETPTERALREFSKEYKRVYGRTPELNETNGYYHVFGYTDGMSVKRLREVTRQLKYRATL